MEIKRKETLNKDMIRFIRRAVGQPVEINYGTVDWAALCRTASRHRVQNLVYEAVRTLPAELQPDERIMTELKQTAGASTVQDMHQYYEMQAVFAELERRKIPVIPLKGWVLKEVYPKSDLRSMSDVDLLIHGEDARAVRDIMSGMGYKTFHYGSGKHDVYRKEPYMSLEFHRRLTGNKDACDVEGIWARSRECDGYEYVRRMSEEDFYLHLIIHMASHMVNGGTGVRSFLDLWIWTERYGGGWDREYIEGRLEELGLDMFARQAQHLAGGWFGDEGEMDEDGVLEGFVLGCGAYGTSDVTAIGNVVVNGEMEKFSKYEKIRYMWSRLFPSYKWMAGRYETLEAHPGALPVYYIYRLYKNGLKRMTAVKREMKNVRMMDKEHISEVQELYGIWGLDAEVWEKWQ